MSEQQKIQTTPVVGEKKYPTEIVALPSGGVFYEKTSPLASGTIELKIPTALQEDILTSRNLIQKGIVIDEFLKSIIVGQVNYDDLLLGDKNGLLIASRILLYGPDYEVTFKCPNCGEQNNLKIDISELNAKEIDDTLKPNSDGEFEYELPVSKTKIKFKLLRHRDEAKINMLLKKTKKYMTSGISSEISTRLSHVITEVRGERGYMSIEKFVKNEMTSRDSRELRNILSKVSPGIDTDVDFMCSECSHEQVISLPMDISFFWPGGQV